MDDDQLPTIARRKSNDSTTANQMPSHPGREIRLLFWPDVLAVFAPICSPNPISRPAFLGSAGLSGESKKSVTRAAAAASVRIFLPLVRMLLRHGIPYKTVAGWLRWCYATVAYEEYSLPGRKPSKSRVAVITGLTRVDVDRLLKQPSPVNKDQYEEYQRAAKVLSGWARDSRYQDQKGQPLKIPFDGDGPSFAALVELYSGGTPPRAVLDELVRVNAVEVLSSGQLKLLSPRYIPAAGEGHEDYMDMLGHATSGLVDTIEFNTQPECEETRLQGVAFNDRIPASELDKMARLIKERGREFIYDTDSLLFDASTPEEDELAEPHVEAGIGVYFFSRKSAAADKE